MSNFPKLVPAFTCHVVLEPPQTIGAVSGSGPLTIAPFAPSGGIKSEPSYPISMDATFIHGSDFIRQDSSGKQVRLDVNSVLKDKSGALVKFTYSGLIALTAPTGAVLGGSADAKTTDFGDAITHVKFETGGEELRALEHKVYVASGRFVVEHGKPLVVEYKISEVTA